MRALMDPEPLVQLLLLGWCQQPHDRGDELGLDGANLGMPLFRGEQRIVPHGANGKVVLLVKGGNRCLLPGIQAKFGPELMSGMERGRGFRCGNNDLWSDRRRTGRPPGKRLKGCAWLHWSRYNPDGCGCGRNLWEEARGRSP